VESKRDDIRKAVENTGNLSTRGTGIALGNKKGSSG